VYWNEHLAGEIRETDEGYEFAYDYNWLGSVGAQPVSLTLPMRPEPYFSRTMIPFFDGLIPEGWLLSVTERTWKLDSRDRMGLLRYLRNTSAGYKQRYLGRGGAAGGLSWVHGNRSSTKALGTSVSRGPQTSTYTCRISVGIYSQASITGVSLSA